jgi:Type ISP C-terminal specificity domain
MMNNFVRHAYRPFDVRWIYWEPETKLLGEKSPEYWPHGWNGNITLSSQQKPRGEWQSSQVVQSIACLDLFDRGSSNFPLKLSVDKGDEFRPNLPGSIEAYLNGRSLDSSILFFHIVAILQAPGYRAENEGALRMDWPRVPIPGAQPKLEQSAETGKALAALLNPETPAPRVSTGSIRPGLRVLGLPTKRGGAPLDSSDLALTAGWGSTQNAGGGNIVMPGRGLTVLRDYTPAERASLEAEAAALGMTLDELLSLIGTRTLDVHLNADAYWSNVPEKVWDYTLGGYQVIKKWLSYRERKVLGRALKPEEAAYVSEMVRRIAAILMMGPALDANYRACAADALTYEALGLSRDAVRERRSARTVKRGLSRKLTPAMKPNKATKKARTKRKKESAPAE